jgi:putative phage-type endonuclease
MEQRTEEWFAARIGKVTASRVADVVAKTKTGYGASRANYMADLICERLTGRKAEGFTNAAMEWGTEQEPNARAAYEARTGYMVTEVGFITHPGIEASGASPDGMVEEGKAQWDGFIEIGLIEIKCPNTATHLDLWLDETIPGKYITQMQWQMACTGAVWCDFVSFDPRLPDNLQLFIKRVPRDDALIAHLEREVTTFLAELDQKVAILKEKNRA